MRQNCHLKEAECTYMFGNVAASGVHIIPASGKIAVVDKSNEKPTLN